MKKTFYYSQVLSRFNQHFFKKINFQAFLCVFVSSLLFSACIFKSNQIVAEDPFTLSNWKQALELRNQERYELSYHYYSLALSSATSEASIVQIKKEMEDMQRVIRSVR